MNADKTLTDIQAAYKGTSIVVDGLENGKEYKFLVQSYVKKWSPKVYVTATPKSASIAPVVTATPGDKQITLSWAKIEGATKYYIGFVNADGSLTDINAAYKDTSIVVDGLTNGTKYKFLVQSYVKKWSPKTYVTATPVSSAPVVKATAGDKQITLSWAKIEGATKYYIGFVNADGSLTDINAAYKDTRIVVDGLTNGTKYKFLVQSYVKKWSPKTYVTATPVSSAPVVTATAGDKEITLSWDKIEGATKYYVGFVNADGSLTDINAAYKDTSIVVDGLTNGTKYKFLVQSYVKKWSPKTYVTATPKAASTAPVVTATPGDKQITLTWDAIDGATKYYIGFVNDDGSLTDIQAAYKKTKLSVDGLTNGKSYTILVQSYVNKKWSPKVLVVATPNTSATAAPVVVATAGDKQVTFKWNAVPNATKYYIGFVNADGSLKAIKSAYTNTSITVGGLTNGTKYKFLVQSYVNKWSPKVYVTATPKAE